MNYTREQLQERYEQLPDNVKEAMLSVKTAEANMQIGKKYGLFIDKIGEMGSEIGYVMLGITHPNEFLEHISKRLKIDQEKAAQIVTDINQEIFLPIRESLKNIHEKHEQKEKILADIENPPETKSTFVVTPPAPPSPPHSMPTVKEIGGPKGEGSLPAILRTVKPGSEPNDIMEKKMKETVRIPMRETRLVPTQSQEHDPYKEKI